MSIELTVNELKGTRAVNEFAVAGISLMIADYLHTLPEEIRLMWPTKWSLVKVIFFVVRYGCFVLAIMVYFCELSPTFYGKDCEIIYTTIAVLEVILSSLGEGIIYIRVWAFSGCDRRVLWYLSIQFVAINIVCFSLLGKFTTSVQVISAAPLVGFSCLAYQGKTMYVAMVYGFMLLSVISLMVIMVGIGLRRSRRSGVLRARNGFMLQFYKDGLSYFLMLGALCVANIICNTIGRDGWQYVMVELQIYLHTMIATRIIMHPRAYSKRGESGDRLPGALNPERRKELQDTSIATSYGGSWRDVIPMFPGRSVETYQTAAVPSTIVFATRHEGVPVGD